MKILFFVFLINSSVQFLLLKNRKNRLKSFFICYVDSAIILLFVVFELAFNLKEYYLFIIMFALLIKIFLLLYYRKFLYNSRVKIIAFCIVSLILSILIIPYIKVEVYTFQYKTELENCYKLTNMFNNPKYFKVFGVKNKKAKVLFGNDEEEIMVFLNRKDGKWIYESYDSIWSSEGSADGLSYPFYR